MLKFSDRLGLWSCRTNSIGILRAPTMRRRRYAPQFDNYARVRPAACVAILCRRSCDRASGFERAAWPAGSLGRFAGRLIPDSRKPAVASELSFEPLRRIDVLLMKRRDPQAPRFIPRKPRPPQAGFSPRTPLPKAAESQSCGYHWERPIGAIAKE
jgi:hypothetical protein